MRVVAVAPCRPSSFEWGRAISSHYQALRSRGGLSPLFFHAIYCCYVGLVVNSGWAPSGHKLKSGLEDGEWKWILFTNAETLWVFLYPCTCCENTSFLPLLFSFCSLGIRKQSKSFSKQKLVVLSVHIPVWWEPFFRDPMTCFHCFWVLTCKKKVEQICQPSQYWLSIGAIFKFVGCLEGSTFVAIDWQVTFVHTEG